MPASSTTRLCRVLSWLYLQTTPSFSNNLVTTRHWKKWLSDTTFLNTYSPPPQATEAQ